MQNPPPNQSFQGRIWKWIFVAFGVFILAVCVQVIWPVFPDGHYSARKAICLSNMKQMTQALSLYAEANDGRLMPGGDWMTLLQPHVPSENSFRCPLLIEKQPLAYGYALSTRFAGKNIHTSERPEREIVLFETMILGRSAMSGMGSMPNPGRHAGSNICGFLDGHAKAP